jgi:hypothetical protein
MITEAHIRRVFRLDYTDQLASYMDAIANGDLNAQVRAITAWRNTPDAIRQALHDCFTFVFATSVLHLDRDDPVLKGLPRPSVDKLFDAVVQRAEQAQIPLRPYWQAIVDFWQPQAEETESSLLARTTRFDGLLNGPLADGSRRRRSEPKPPRAPRIQPGPNLSVHAASAAPLTKEQVRAIWEAASFQVQQYGHTLNARLAIDHGLLGTNHVEHATDSVSEFVRQIGMRIRDWGGLGVEFHFCYVHGPGPRPDCGLETRLAMVIPEQLEHFALDWLDAFVSRRFGGEIARRAIRMKFGIPHRNEQRWTRHVQLLRWLCGDISPDLRVVVSGESRQLASLLGIRCETRTERPVLPARRMAISQTLSFQRRQAAIVERLRPLSAFADGAWDFIASGWELDEFIHRTRLRQERAAAVALIAAQWPSGVNLLQDARREHELAVLRATWPDDPRQQLRVKPLWW